MKAFAILALAIAAVVAARAATPKAGPGACMGGNQPATACKTCETCFYCGKKGRWGVRPENTGTCAVCEKLKTRKP